VTSSHVIFIPMVLAVGVFLGFMFGARAARNAYDLQHKRDLEREQVRAERAARKAASAGDQKKP
jgi:hypothetical protein